MSTPLPTPRNPRDPAPRRSVRVSVVIPAHGAAEPLRRCLEAIARQTRAPDEIIVVDNGIEAGARVVPDGLERVRLVTEERRGSYAARNRGVEAAAGDVLAFTDADCEPAPEWLEEAVNFIGARPDVSIVAGAIEVFAASDPPTAAELIELRHGFPQEEYVRRSAFGATANLTVRRSTFDHAGGFDPELLSGGDFEWCRRAVAAGHLIEFAPRARVRHPARTRVGDLVRKERRVSRGLCELARRGRLPRRMLRAALLTAARPPLLHAGAMLADSSSGPLGVRFRAALLLALLRVVRAATLLTCAFRRAP